LGIGEISQLGRKPMRQQKKQAEEGNPFLKNTQMGNHIITRLIHKQGKESKVTMSISIFPKVNFYGTTKI